MSKRKTTAPGYRNKNGQVNLSRTEPPRRGTDYGQHIYILHCLGCGRNYGANGSDIWQRKCPYCQGGTPGLELTSAELALEGSAVIEKEP